jgi:hypothetical protein
MARTSGQNGRWIVIAALLVLAALVVWIVLKNDVPTDGYNP